MSFLSPVWLWSLLALIPLAAVYLLKVRPTRKKTNAYFLWEKIFQEKQTSALFQRLRDVFSLLLMMLVFAAIAFALSRPRFSSSQDSDLLIVIDTSASMQAKSKGKSRLSLAKDKARDIIRALNGDWRVAIATIDRQLKFRSHLTSNPKELFDVIRAIRPSDEALSPHAARSLASYTSHQKDGSAPSHRVIFLTDGSSALPALDSNIEVTAVGDQVPNLGIVAADLQWTPGKSKSAQFYVRIENSHTSPVDAELELRHSASGLIGKLVPIHLKPGEPFEEIFQLDMVEPGVWTMSLITDDAFALDNQVSLGLNPRQAVGVRIHASNPWFFQHCIQAFSRTGGLLELQQKNAAVTLAEGKVVSETPITIIFHPQGESTWWSNLGEEISSVVPKVLYPDHPIVRHLDISGIPFAGARKLTAPKKSLILVEAQDGTPLIYQSSQNGKSVVVLNMDPAQADFFLSPWFPAIIHSCTLHLAGRESRVAPLYTTGDSFTIPGNGSEAVITRPDGKKETLPSGSSITLSRAGAYHCSSGKDQWAFGAALLSPPDTHLQITSNTSTRPLASGWPPSLWLLCAAILLLVIESILYHRRKVG